MKKKKRVAETENAEITDESAQSSDQTVTSLTKRTRTGIWCIAPLQCRRKKKVARKKK